jgi:uncharacterized lipoprotein YbaY/heat shock protein HslJ
MKPETASVSGTVSYRERILLQPGSRVEITLEDVSRADAPAVPVASVELTDPGQVPIPFEIAYDPSKIDSRMNYALRARILGPDGSLLFINDTHTPVITRDAGDHADMLLVAAGQSQAENESSGMPLEGMFQYFADAPRFRDCRTGRSYPVEMSGQYIELERAYLNSGIEPGKELKVTLLGRYLERPGVEENTNQIMLIVEAFREISETQDCAPPALAELINTYWKLVSLNGAVIKPVADQKEAHMTLQAQDNRLLGFGGCNRFFGSYVHDGENLSFSGMGSTMMACPEGMETEQAFLLALGKTNRAVISGEFLELFQDQRKLARFEAVYF